MHEIFLRWNQVGDPLFRRLGRWLLIFELVMEMVDLLLWVWQLEVLFKRSVVISGRRAVGAVLMSSEANGPHSVTLQWLHRSECWVVEEGIRASLVTVNEGVEFHSLLRNSVLVGQWDFATVSTVVAEPWTHSELQSSMSIRTFLEFESDELGKLRAHLRWQFDEFAEIEAGDTCWPLSLLVRKVEMDLNSSFLVPLATFLGQPSNHS